MSYRVLIKYCVFSQELQYILTPLTCYWWFGKWQANRNDGTLCFFNEDKLLSRMQGIGINTIFLEHRVEREYLQCGENCVVFQ